MSTTAPPSSLTARTRKEVARLRARYPKQNDPRWTQLMSELSLVEAVLAEDPKFPSFTGSGPQGHTPKTVRPCGWGLSEYDRTERPWGELGPWGPGGQEKVYRNRCTSWLDQLGNALAAAGETADICETRGGEVLYSLAGETGTHRQLSRRPGEVQNPMMTAAEYWWNKEVPGLPDGPELGPLLVQAGMVAGGIYLAGWWIQHLMLRRTITAAVKKGNR